MIVLRAFPLSLSVFVSFLFISPILFIVIMLYGIVAGILAGVLMNIIPPLAFLVIMGFSLAAAVVPTMVGIRIALQSRGVTPAVGYRSFLMPSVMYGVIETILITVLLLIFAGVIVLFSAIGIEELMAAWFVGDISSLEGDGTGSLILFLVGFGLGTLGYVAVRSSLLVPLASAAIGRDPDGSFYTPLKNFGAGVVPLTILSLLSLALVYSSFIIAIVFVAFFAEPLSPADIEQAFSEAARRFSLSVIPFQVWAVLLLTSAIMLLGFSLQCAGAALVWLRLADNVGAVEAAAAPRIDQEELRELWKSRMPKGNK